MIAGRYRVRRYDLRHNSFTIMFLITNTFYNRWFCHFDDDNYVNVPRLVSVLQKYNHQEDWYLGRTSVYEPVKIYKKPTNQVNTQH